MYIDLSPYRSILRLFSINGCADKMNINGGLFKLKYVCFKFFLIRCICNDQGFVSFIKYAACKKTSDVSRFPQIKQMYSSRQK